MTNQDTINDSQELLIAITNIGKIEVYHSVQTACEKFKISRSTFGRWKKEGKLPATVEINEQERYRDSDLDRMVLRQNMESLAPNQVAKDTASIVGSF
ncbi:MAG: hypothetical protein RPT25_06545 [Cycloclasticus sp.]|jgi:hypothetical protein